MHECAESAPMFPAGLWVYITIKERVFQEIFLYIFTNVMKFSISIFVHYADCTRDMKRKKGVERINV